MNSHAIDPLRAFNEICRAVLPAPKAFLEAGKRRLGKKVTARNVAMMTMSDRAVQAGETTNIEAVRDTMRIVVTKAGAVPMTRTTVALQAAADMAAGLATPRAIPRPHAAVGKTVGNQTCRFILSSISPWPRPGASIGEPVMPTTKAKGLEELFSDTLKDIYYAEKQILRALPKMAKSASSAQLSEAFEKHRQETEGHVERLEQIFEAMGKPARGKTCDAIVGILEEGKEIMEDYAGDSALDAGLAASAQAVEHYEIARYGTLRTWADELGMQEASKLLDQTLQEEIKTDQLLTKLATSVVNQAA
jgi:ferritin-like metal-binding protein YciE